MSHYLYTQRGFVTLRDHIHHLVREDVTEDGQAYRYRCVDCMQRLKRLSGVLVAKPLERKAKP